MMQMLRRRGWSDGGCRLVLERCHGGIRRGLGKDVDEQTTTKSHVDVSNFGYLDFFGL